MHTDIAQVRSELPFQVLPERMFERRSRVLGGPRDERGMRILRRLGGTPFNQLSESMVSNGGRQLRSGWLRQHGLARMPGSLVSVRLPALLFRGFARLLHLRLPRDLADRIRLKLIASERLTHLLVLPLDSSEQVPHGDRASLFSR